METRWQDDAACSGQPVALFEVSARGVASSLARRICEDCPVWGECLTAGWRDGYMLRGRTTPDERVALRRKGLTAADVIASEMTPVPAAV